MDDERERDGWEEHRRRQIRDLLATTPAERLAWVEEVIDLARRAGIRDPRTSRVRAPDQPPGATVA